MLEADDLHGHGEVFAAELFERLRAAARPRRSASRRSAAAKPVVPRRAPGPVAGAGSRTGSPCPSRPCRVDTHPSMTMRVLAAPSGCLPRRPAGSSLRMGAPGASALMQGTSASQGRGGWRRRAPATRPPPFPPLGPRAGCGGPPPRRPRPRANVPAPCGSRVRPPPPGMPAGPARGPATLPAPGRRPPGSGRISCPRGGGNRGAG